MGMEAGDKTRDADVAAVALWLSEQWWFGALVAVAAIVLIVGFVRLVGSAP